MITDTGTARPAVSTESQAVAQLVADAGLPILGLEQAWNTLVRAALAAADADVGSTASIALLTETAPTYFHRFGFTDANRSELPQALDASPELHTLCPSTARAFLRA